MVDISILIPVFNMEKYLPRCLNTVMEQKFDGTFEVICVNDGSTDKSGEILEEFSNRYPEIKVINQKNQGLGATRLSAINVAQGEYIGFVDSDDCIGEDYFQKLYTAAKNHNADVATTTRVLMCGDNPRPALKDCGISKNAEIIESKEEKARIVITTGICWNKIYKKSFLDKYDICHFGSAPGTDNYFTTCSVISANKIAVVHDAPYYYTLRNNSITHVLKGKKDFGIFENYASIDRWIDKQSDFTEYEKQYWKFINTKRKQYDFSIFYRTMSPECKNEFLLLAKDNLKIDNLIVSLTSYPARINLVNQTIMTILNQTVQAEKVILWLAGEQFPNKEKDLPQQLLDLTEKGLTIEWCEDIKSYKKLIPTLKKYPNSIIVTADDDVLYKNNWLEQLYGAYIKEPDYVHCHRAHYVAFAGNEILPYKKWKQNIPKFKPSFNNFFTGSGGVLYPPNCFYGDVLKSELFMELCPHADDIWFWAMCILNNRKINIVTGAQPLNLVDGSQEEALWYSNLNEGQNDVQLKKVVEHYPEILSKLDKTTEVPDSQEVAISIVIPVYNVETYLKRCLNSIVEQNFPKDKFEVICVDDGSTDSSPQILNEFETQYENVKVFKVEKEAGTSKGPGEARNTGLINAKGKYLLFIDADDFIMPNTLDILYNYAEENNSDVVVFDFYKGSAGSVRPTIHSFTNVSKKYGNTQFNAEIAEKFVYRCLPVAPWGKLYLRELIKDFRYIKDIYYQDVPFWDLVFLNAKRINYLPYPLYFYDATRDTNITSAKNQKVFDVFKSFGASRENLKKYGYYEKYKYILYAHATCNFYKHLTNVSDDLRKDFINEIKNFGIEVSFEDFKKEDFVEYEYEIFRLMKYIQANDYDTVMKTLKDNKILT